MNIDDLNRSEPPAMPLGGPGARAGFCPTTSPYAVTELVPRPAASSGASGASFTARQLPELRAGLVRLLGGPAPVSLTGGNTFYGDRYFRSGLLPMLAAVDPRQLPDELRGV